MMMASLVRISWVWILSNVVIHTLGFVQLPVESLRRGMTVRSGGYNALIDEKLERNQVKLGTFFDIFSAVDSSFSSAIAPKTETDVYIPISINEAASASSKALDNEKFVVPDTRAWLSSIATLEYTEPPQVVAPPSIVTPPDVITFFKTGVLNSFHEAKVLELYEKTSSLSYLNEQETVKVKEALRVAYVAFFGKTTRRSMEVLINRSRGTAGVLGELKADADVVIAGILHDVLSELPSNEFFWEMRSHLVELFGLEAVSLVEVYSRLPRFLARKTSYTPMQSENQVQMLVASAEDYRGLYIRLADRLHTMRVLRSLPLQDSERLKIAQEALNVYAPLAHKMGVMSVKGELEDLAFRVLNPDLFLESKRTQWLAHKALHDGAAQIQDFLSNDPHLAANEVTFRLPYRVKDKYQLALKMARKGLKSVNDVRDAVGMRVIIDTPRREGESEEAWNKRGEELCYYIVSHIRKLEGWEPSAGGFKDYITARKDNGYASLHQYMHNLAMDTHLEIQVRTRQMHMEAELGEAAHWSYKDSLYRPEIANSKLYKIAWRSPEQAKAKSAAELIGLAKKQLNAERVFVFLGDESTVINIKKGATCLDAAFAIHTNIGLKTKSISVNGKGSTFRRVMRTGDVIKVECMEEVGAQSSWLSLARLPYTQAVIRKHLRQKHRSTIAVLGCAQFLMALALNKDLIMTKFDGVLPSTYQMQRYSRTRLSKDLGELLTVFGSSKTTNSTIAAHLSKLLDLPYESLNIVPVTSCLSWVRQQMRNGWDDVSLRSTILKPLLQDIMPTCGLVDVMGRWRELVGNDLCDCDDAVARISMPFSMGGPFRPLFEVKVRAKSQISIAQRPFSLEASSMSSSLRQLARSNVAASILQV